MEVKKISQNEYDFILTYPNICNVIHKEVLKDKHTTFASCVKNHPHEIQTIIKIKSTDKFPKEIINNAFNNILKEIDSLYELSNKF